MSIHFLFFSFKCQVWSIGVQWPQLEWYSIQDLKNRSLLLSSCFELSETFVFRCTLVALVPSAPDYKLLTPAQAAAIVRQLCSSTTICTTIINTRTSWPFTQLKTFPSLNVQLFLNSHMRRWTSSMFRKLRSSFRLSVVVIIPVCVVCPEQLMWMWLIDQDPDMGCVYFTVTWNWV